MMETQLERRAKSGEAEWMTVKEFLVQHKGKLGRSFVYERLRDGSLPSVRLGRKILLRADVLQHLEKDGRGQATGGVGQGK